MNCCTNLAGSLGCIGFKRAIDFLRSISYITETASYSTIAYRFHKSRSGRCYFLISLFCFLLDGVFRLLYYLLWMGHCILHPFSSRFYSTDDCFYSFLCCTLNPAPQGMSCRITVIQRIIGRIIIAVSGQWIYYYFNNTLEDIYKQWVQHRAETQIVSQKTIEEDDMTFSHPHRVLSIRVLRLFRWSQPCPTYGMDLFARSVLQRLYSLKSEVMAGLSHSAFPFVSGCLFIQFSICMRLV